MAVTITITTAGSSISDPLAVYTSPDNVVWTFDSNVAKATLLTGYTFTPPVGTYYYQVRDLGECETILSLNCTTTTTTTSTSTTSTTSTSTTTTTTTATPTTTTTTTAAPVTYDISIFGHPSEPTVDTGNVYYSIDAGPDILLGSLGTNLCKFIGVITGISSGSILHLGVLNGSSSCVSFDVAEVTAFCPVGFTAHCGTVNTCTGYTTFFPIVASYDISITADCTGETYVTCP
jgi:hypothetical protein